MQLTVFSDGILHTRALLIFCEQRLRFKNSKKGQWDKIVTFQLQKNAWCDQGDTEPGYVTWIQNDWGSYCSNPPTPDSDGKFFICVVIMANRHLKVKNYLRRCKKQLANFPDGLTGYVQVLDVVVSIHFSFQRLSVKHQIPLDPGKLNEENTLDDDGHDV